MGIDPSCRNPYKSIVLRAIEVVYAFEEALRLIDGYVVPAAPHVHITPRAGVGHGVRHTGTASAALPRGHRRRKNCGT